MNKETYEFFNCEVSFDEKAIRNLLASQLGNKRYIEGKKMIIEVIFNRSLDYQFRKNALELIFKHLSTQGCVIYGNSGISTSEMLKIMRSVLN